MCETLKLRHEKVRFQVYETVKTGTGLGIGPESCGPLALIPLQLKLIYYLFFSFFGRGQNKYSGLSISSS